MNTRKLLTEIIAAMTIIASPTGINAVTNIQTGTEQYTDNINKSIIGQSTVDTSNCSENEEENSSNHQKPIKIPYEIILPELGIVFRKRNNELYKPIVDDDMENNTGLNAHKRSTPEYLRIPQNKRKHYSTRSFCVQ